MTDLGQIYTRQFLWKEIDAVEVQSKILNGDRPSRPEGEKKHSSTTELWRMFGKCWGKDSSRRISASEVLDVLQYLWVLTSFV